MRDFAMACVCCSLLVSAAACGDDDDDDLVDASTTLDAAILHPDAGDARVIDPDDAGFVDAGDAGAALNDSQIVMAMQRIHLDEITLGELADVRATRSDVRTFAELLVQRHTQAVQHLQAIVDTQDITPEPSDLSTELDHDADEVLVALTSVPSAEFDAEYMASQVEWLEQVLDLLDDRLIPSAEDTLLRAHLMSTRVDVEADLQEAVEIQDALEADSGQL